MTVLNRTGRVFSTLREAGTGQPVLTFRAAMAAKSLSGAVSPSAASTSRGNLYGLAVESTTIGAALGETAPESDFAAMAALNVKTGCPVPASLSVLNTLPVRFNTVIEPAAIRDAALK